MRIVSQPVLLVKAHAPDQSFVRKKIILLAVIEKNITFARRDDLGRIYGIITYINPCFFLP